MMSLKLNLKGCDVVSDHEQSDVGEESCSDGQQHHRPREPEAQDPKVKPAHKHTCMFYCASM